MAALSAAGSAAKVETTLGEAVWQVDARYQPIRLVGSGAYGVVCAALDRKTGRDVAIKKIQKAFDIFTIAKRTLLEIKLLRHFHNHDDIIRIEGILQPPAPPSPFNDVYLVMELLECDLQFIIHSRQALTIEHVRYFLYQILRGLKYIHSAKVLHRDIKPGNCLVSSNCDLKICDFGMARGIASNPMEHAGFMTAYVATRWYRAPEVMLSFREYTYAIDLWSAACIFAEMLGRKHPFPSKTYVDHLSLVLKLTGLPSDDCISRIGSEKAQSYFRSLQPIDPPPLRDKYPDATPDAIDLLEKMLKFDPDDRISVDGALQHPFLAKYHDPTDEPTCAEFSFDFESENGDLSAQDLRDKIMEEIRLYAPGNSPRGSMSFPGSPSHRGSGTFPTSPVPSRSHGAGASSPFGPGARAASSRPPASSSTSPLPSSTSPGPTDGTVASGTSLSSKRRRTSPKDSSSDVPRGGLGPWAALSGGAHVGTPSSSRVPGRACTSTPPPRNGGRLGSRTPPPRSGIFGSRTPPPPAAASGGSYVLRRGKRKAAASPPPGGWGAVVVAGARERASPERRAQQSVHATASAKLGTPSMGLSPDAKWLAHVDPEWLNDQELQTELEKGASHVFKSSPT
eukprot:m.191179 g.191179  ORF g.191179 m.191179 type:complete len:623 (-) comp18266_c0_seq1:142-2010(-)